MSSVGKKLTLNFGKLRKKLSEGSSESRSSSDPQDSLAPYLDFDSAHCSRHDSRGRGHKQAGPIKSTSLCSINTNEVSDDVSLDQDDINILTQDVKRFSDSLSQLKAVFLEDSVSDDDVGVIAHERLGEVLSVLRSVLQRYQSLHSTQLFTASAALISLIKRLNGNDEADHEKDDTSTGGRVSVDDDGDEPDVQELCDAIDELALTFSSSVSEYLMGGPNRGSVENEVRAQSFDNILTLSTSREEEEEDEEEVKCLTPEEIDRHLMRLDAGVDLALQRAKAWSKYAKDLILYVERKSQYEADYAKSLTRLAQSVRTNLTEEGFLPFQSVYCTALSQDLEFASTVQATSLLLQTQKFVAPLNSRRGDHDKSRKSLKDQWTRECKRMQDALNNLRKAKAMHIQRHVEFDRAHELALRAEAELAGSSAGGASIQKTLDKRKKLEEDAMHKAMESETTYKACVAEANLRQQELQKTKKSVLTQIREQIFLSDQVMKRVTLEYFQLQHTVSAPVPIQYQALCDSSQIYESGSQYREFCCRLPAPSGENNTPTQTYTFEPYAPHRSGERKSSGQSDGSWGSEHQDGHSHGITKDRISWPTKAWIVTGPHGVSDSESGSSNKSMDSSPNASPLSDSLHSPNRLTHPDSTSVMKRAGARRSITFGIDFSEQLELTRTDVPPIVVLCLREIEERGMLVKGLYRVSGVKSKVEALCQRFDTAPFKVDLSKENPNVISNVLKLYLRQLPEPLLTFELYPEFIKIAKEDMAGLVSTEITVERLQETTSRMVHANFRTAATLMHHLSRVATYIEINHMNANNLGIVLGPTLLGPREGTSSLTSLVDTPHQTRTVELLIMFAKEIFGDETKYPLICESEQHTKSKEKTHQPASVTYSAPAIQTDDGHHQKSADAPAAYRHSQGSVGNRRSGHYSESESVTSSVKSSEEKLPVRPLVFLDTEVRPSQMPVIFDQVTEGSQATKPGVKSSSPVLQPKVRQGASVMVQKQLSLAMQREAARKPLTGPMTKQQALTEAQSNSLSLLKSAISKSVHGATGTGTTGQATGGGQASGGSFVPEIHDILLAADDEDSDHAIHKASSSPSSGLNDAPASPPIIASTPGTSGHSAGQSESNASLTSRQCAAAAAVPVVNASQTSAQRNTTAYRTKSAPSPQLSPASSLPLSFTTPKLTTQTPPVTAPIKPSNVSPTTDALQRAPVRLLTDSAPALRTSTMNVTTVKAPVISSAMLLPRATVAMPPTAAVSVQELPASPSPRSRAVVLPASSSIRQSSAQPKITDLTGYITRDHDSPKLITSPRPSAAASGNKSAGDHSGVRDDTEIFPDQFELTFI